MTLPFSTFLFDLDGTIIDHFKAIHRAHAHTMRTLGLAEPTLAQVHAAVGGGVENAIGRLAGKDRVAEAMAVYWPYWEATMLDDVALLPGTLELFKMLASEGVTVAVYTNKHGPSSRRICERLGLMPFVRGVFGATDTPWLKPEPRFTEFVLQQLNVTAVGTVLVGDSPWDVQAAKNGGFPSWCVTTGTHNAEELAAAGASKVFADLIALRRAIEC